MKQSYPQNPEICKLVQAKPETIRFLTDFSKSLSIVTHKGLTFENTMN